MHSWCFLRNFRDAQEELQFPFKCLSFWRAKCNIFGKNSAGYFRGCPSSLLVFSVVMPLSWILSSSVLPFRFALLWIAVVQVLHGPAITGAVLVSWMTWSLQLFGKSSPHSKFIWKSLSPGNVSCVRPCQTVTLVFSWCAVLLEQDFMESIQNAYQCNVGKCFMCGWTWMWGDNINPKLWQKLILMSFLFLLALTCFYKYCVVEWIPDWWMWKPAYQCLKGKAFKYK